MRHVVNHQVVLSQAPEGPLARWLEGFADAASRQGYTRSSICRRICLAAGFSRWLGQEGIGLSCISSEHPAQYLRSRTRRIRCHPDAAPLRHLIDFLRLEAVIPTETIPLGREPETEAKRCVLAYEQYLSETRGLATATILGYLPGLSHAPEFWMIQAEFGRVRMLRLPPDNPSGGFTVSNSSGTLP